MRHWVSIVLAVSSMGCLDHIAELGPKLKTQRDRGDPISEADIATSCGGSVEEGGIRGCLIDSTGEVVEVDGTLPVFPQQPPYGMIVRLDGIVIRQADLESEEAIRARAYGAPYNISSCQGLPEAEPEREIPARTLVAKDGGMIVLVEHAQPGGSQIVFDVEFGTSWLVDHDFPVGMSTPCDDANEKCSALEYQVGYVGRLYVGDEPSSSCN